MTIKTFSALVGAVLLSLTVSGSAFAMDGAALYKSKTCFSCHGQDAKTPILPIYPRLAGQNAEYALNQMKDIKSGARANGQFPAECDQSASFPGVHAPRPAAVGRSLPSAICWVNCIWYNL